MRLLPPARCAYPTYLLLDPRFSSFLFLSLLPVSSFYLPLLCRPASFRHTNQGVTLLLSLCCQRNAFGYTQLTCLEYSLAPSDPAYFKLIQTEHMRYTSPQLWRDWPSQSQRWWRYYYRQTSRYNENLTYNYGLIMSSQGHLVGPTVICQSSDSYE